MTRAALRREGRRRPARCRATGRRPARSRRGPGRRGAGAGSTRSAKSYADPVTVFAASGEPCSNVAPEGSVSETNTSSSGAGRPLVANANLRVIVPRKTTCLTRSVGGGTASERLVHVERVRPRLHEPRGRHRGRAHRRAEPRAASRPRGTPAASSRAAAGPPAPARQQLSRRQPYPPSSAALSTYPDRVLERLEDAGVPRLLVGGGDHRDLVGPGQVRDLRRDVPALGGRRCTPLLVGEPCGPAASSWSPSAARSVEDLVELVVHRRAPSVRSRGWWPTGRGSCADGPSRR